LRFNKPLGEVGFRPGEDMDIARFEEGLHSATILYWPQDRGERGREEARSFTWQFRAH
jgi:hypothetical protein